MPPTDPTHWLLEERRAVGERVRTLRLERNLSQEQLAELTVGFLSRKAISRLENGVQACTIDQLNAVARALAVPTWRLFWS